MKSTITNKKSVLASKLLVAVAAGALALMAPAVMAQQHGGGGKGGGGGHDGGSGTSHTSGDDGHSSHDSGGGKGGKKGGQEAGRGKGSGGSSLRDVFREMEDEAAAEKGKKGPPQGKGPSAEKVKGSDQAKKGKKPDAAVAEEEDSDRPAWAGPNPTEPKPGSRSTEPGIKKGDIYGDMYVIVRNEDGTPDLDADGNVKVKFLYDDPNDDSTEPVLVCCIDRDSEGNLVLVDPTNPSLGYVGTVEGTTTTVEGVTPIEVELGRLSVGRSPTRVLSAQLEEAISKIDDAASVKLDASGRIILVAEDNTESTIDSPLENLALYLELINTGTIDGVTDEKLKDLGIVLDDALSDEYKLASSLFAAASDKTIPVTIDAIVYMNTILGIEGTLQGEDEDPKTTYVDYSDFTYDRSDFYDGVKVTILVPDDPTNPTSWTPTEVDVFEVVFKDADLSATGVEGFTQATDDARTVINYIHEYSVPVAPTTTN